MHLFLAVTPEDAQAASKFRGTPVHVAYRIGPDSTLLRQNLLLQSRGGLLSVSDRDAPRIDDPDALCAAVLRECGRRGYSGALLDFEEPLRSDRLAFARRLGTALNASRKTLYLPESCREAGQQAVILLCTAMSGGNFTERLQEEIRRSGAGHLGLDVQRLRMDFRLPARSGEGTPLSRETLARLRERESPTVFFSPDLCARYFTYSHSGETHFVLFDDAGTIAQKLRIGTSLGLSAAFFMWPEIQDIAGDLFRIL